MSIFSGEQVASPNISGTPEFSQTPATTATAGAIQAVPATVLGYINATIKTSATAEPVAIKIPYFSA